MSTGISWLANRRIKNMRKSILLLSFCVNFGALLLLPQAALGYENDGNMGICYSDSHCRHQLSGDFVTHNSCSRLAWDLRSPRAYWLTGHKCIPVLNTIAPPIPPQETPTSVPYGNACETGGIPCADGYSCVGNSMQGHYCQ